MDLLSTKVAYASRLDTFLFNVNTLIINPLIILLFALAVMYFLYGVLEFLMNAGNDEKRTTGKNHMIWGIIGITIMMGVWAILGIVLRTLNIDSNQVNPEQGTVTLPPYTPPSPNNLTQ